LSNASAVLRLFSPERLDVSVTIVSQLLGMPKSSASRLLKAMLREGLLARVEGSAKYKVGNLLFEVARLYRLNSSLIGAADDALSAVCRATGHTGYISILDGSDVLVIRAHQGSHALRVFTPLGQRAPAFATSTGRALLARLSDDAAQALCAENLTPPSPNTPQSIDDLLALLAEVRVRGWAEAIDEAIPGVGSISTAVVDVETGERLSMCISFPSSMISQSERNRIVTLLVAAARQVGAKFDDSFHSQLEFVRLSGGSAAA
jgi:IclR family transcriptional regulator, KDG regulon repressor